MKNKLSKSIIYLALFTLLGILFLNSLISYYSKGLPSVNEVIEYQPKTLSKVFDRNNQPLGVFFVEKREFIPIEKIPDLVRFAFISAEDKHFYRHPGYDISGLLKALVDFSKGYKLRGASTITQQVTKGFLLSGERTLERKIKELILAIQLEKALSKNEILEIYLNEVYLGEGAYGVSAAADTYFAKKLEELSPSEAAFLAALPKLPEAYNPKKNKVNAIQRRNFVLTEMVENGYLPVSQLIIEKDSQLETVQSGEVFAKQNLRLFEGFLAEDIIKHSSRLLGERFFSQGGFSIKTSIDSNLQEIAREALEKEVETLDIESGSYRQPIAHIETSKLSEEFGWVQPLQKENSGQAKFGWHLAVVVAVNDEDILVGTDRSYDIGQLHFLQTIRPNLKVGNVVYVQDISDKESSRPEWLYKQKPFFDGGIIISDLRTGEVLALHGGYSYKFNNLNKITEVKRPRLEFLKPVLSAVLFTQLFNSDEFLLTELLTGKNAETERRLLKSLTTNEFISQKQKFMIIRELFVNSGADLHRILFNKSSLNLLANFDVIDNTTSPSQNLKIRSETTILDVISAYNILSTGKKKKLSNFLIEIHKGEKRIFPKESEMEACSNCQGEQEMYELSKLADFDFNSPENKVDKNILELFNLEHFELSKEIDGAQEMTLIGKHEFDKDLFFDSVIGIISDKVFGCHLELDQANIQLDPNILLGSCFSVIKRILSHDISK